MLIPRRGRLARLHNLLDGVQLENSLRTAGLTLVFIDHVLRPLRKGRRQNLAELLVATLEYDRSGEGRRKLADKMSRAQIALARRGFSTGGRPPYGFRRWLAREDGTRSMGDQLRFTPEGPRELEESDYRRDNRPKVIRNPESARLTAPAHFEPVVDPERHRKLIEELDRRAGTQRGKPRSKDPARNPLGTRCST